MHVTVFGVFSLVVISAIVLPLLGLMVYSLRKMTSYQRVNLLIIMLIIIVFILLLVYLPYMGKAVYDMFRGN